MRVTVQRKEHFNAAHKLEVPSWSAAKNREVFGKCANENFHGHNYDVYVYVTGEIDPVTGYVIDIKYLGDLIREEVVERFDHKNLNLDVAEFKDKIPTAENIAIVIYYILKEKLDPKFDIKIKLYETERNIVEFPAIQ